MQNHAAKVFSWISSLDPERFYVSSTIDGIKADFAKGNWAGISKFAENVTESTKTILVILLRMETATLENGQPCKTIMGMKYHCGAWVAMNTNILECYHQINMDTITPLKPKQEITYADITLEYTDCPVAKPNPQDEIVEEELEEGELEGIAANEEDSTSLEHTSSLNVSHTFTSNPQEMTESFEKIFGWLGALESQKLFTVINLGGESRLFDKDNWYCIKAFIQEYAPCFEARFAIFRDKRDIMGAEYQDGEWKIMSQGYLSKLHTIDPENFNWCEATEHSQYRNLKTEYPSCPIAQGKLL